MQTMFHYSIKAHVSYAREKDEISYPDDFIVFHITRHIFFCAHFLGTLLFTAYDPPYALGYI